MYFYLNISVTDIEHVTCLLFVLFCGPDGHVWEGVM